MTYAPSMDGCPCALRRWDDGGLLSNAVIDEYMMQSILQFLKSEEGPTAVEYAVMLMLVLAVCIAAIQVISDWLHSSMTNSSDEIEDYLT